MGDDLLESTKNPFEQRDSWIDPSPYSGFVDIDLNGFTDGR
jgi:hypothetical protein